MRSRWRIRAGSIPAHVLDPTVALQRALTMVVIPAVRGSCGVVLFEESMGYKSIQSQIPSGDDRWVTVWYVCSDGQRVALAWTKEDANKIVKALRCLRDMNNVSKSPTYKVKR